MSTQNTKISLKAEKLEILANKLKNFNDFSYTTLKENLLNNKLSVNDRITKQDLTLLQEYQSDRDRLGLDNPDFIEKWVLPNKPDGYFAHVMDATDRIERDTSGLLLGVVKEKNKVSSALIPIKGISQAMTNKLKDFYIYDISSLLQKGKTQSKRNELASKLGVDVKLVNSWVKQADLWKVEGMTPDTAFLLVQIGVRNVHDLAKVDVNKAYPIMQRLCFTQTDFLLEEQNVIEGIIENADELVYRNFGIRRLLLTFETNEPEPDFLFRDETDNTIKELLKTSGEIIREGLNSLDDIIPALPLPHTIRGRIYMKNSVDPEFNNYPFANAKVEISGISSSSADQSEAGIKPFGYTDGDGNFIIVMPDRYNLQEAVTITVSQGADKQTFIKSASDIINSVKEQKILDLFHKLDFIKEILDSEKTKKDIYVRLNNCLETNPNSAAEIKAEIEKWEPLMPEIEAEIELQTQAYINTEKEIRQAVADNTVMSLKRLLNNLVSRNDFEADLGVLILTDEIFKGLSAGLKKTLPSVKLMENDNKAVRLSTDTAPARIFSYSMLQRLVEPSVFPYAEKDTPRKKLSSPVDVMTFKENMYKKPKSIPKMSSLGIGYVLNMHQAWVPDGFALGSLLYSLVLAPGEEQRLVVREKSQTYTVSDNAEASDSARENYTLTQNDDAMAVYNYALNQLSKANSQSGYSAQTSSYGGGFGIGGVLGGFSAMLGLSGSHSKSSGSASSSASQSNAHNEVSSAAQNFQHSIKSASEKVAQAKRISVRAATSVENDSVATKIIANHNHSHTLTIQYWEVMRRYRMETCIDGVELVLFVPLEIISFMKPELPYVLSKQDVANFDIKSFESRYGQLLHYADLLLPHLPYKYKNGLELIKKYASYPTWKREEAESVSSKFLELKFNCNILEFDDIKATLVLKNGKGTIAGTLNKFSRKKLSTEIITSLQLKQEIIKERNQRGEAYTFSFVIPSNVIGSDIDYIRLEHSCDSFSYNLNQSEEYLSSAQKTALDNMLGKEKDLAKDNDSSGSDRNKIAHYKSQLPEAFLAPIVTLSSRELYSYGSPVVSNVSLSYSGSDELVALLTSSTFNPSLRVNVQMSCRVLRNSELQEMESTLHHILSDTLHYSQVVWGSLSDDERAMMLEGYTIDMNFDNLKELEDMEQVNSGNISQNTRIIDKSLKNSPIINNKIGNVILRPQFKIAENDSTDIPLLNCVNIKKLLGFYGNCILLPFTFPQSLAKKLDKTAAEIQDALYRYHTAYFRVPSTTISLPTDGMIGEAVLGETNVSELIDLTRFWNWKDSPIDKMDIGKDYINNTDYLDGKAPAGTTALNIQSAVAPQSVTITDLINTLVGKQTPQFGDITGLEQLKDILNEGTKSASSGRDKILDSNSAMLGKVIDLLKLKPEIEKNNNSNDDTADKTGGAEAGGPGKPDGPGESVKAPENRPVTETDNETGK